MGQDVSAVGCQGTRESSPSRRTHLERLAGVRKDIFTIPQLPVNLSAHQQQVDAISRDFDCLVQVVFRSTPLTALHRSFPAVAHLLCLLVSMSTRGRARAGERQVRWGGRESVKCKRTHQGLLTIIHSYFARLLTPAGNSRERVQEFLNHGKWDKARPNLSRQRHIPQPPVPNPRLEPSPVPRTYSSRDTQSSADSCRHLQGLDILADGVAVPFDLKSRTDFRSASRSHSRYLPACLCLPLSLSHSLSLKPHTHTHTHIPIPVPIHTPADEHISRYQQRHPHASARTRPPPLLAYCMQERERERNRERDARHLYKHIVIRHRLRGR